MSMLVLIDLAAAFDTIDHTILLHRLQYSFGISDVALSWFCSYLTDRTLRVCVNGKYSESSVQRYGVPQGSVLGPLLFTLYFSSISNVLNQWNISHAIFADDIQFYLSDDSSNIQSLTEKVKNCTVAIKNWMLSNKLMLNDYKTDVLLVVPRKDSSHPSLPTIIDIGDDINIPISDRVRDLGVVLDSNLTLEKWISDICRSTYFELRRISSVRRYLTFESTKLLVCSFVLSRLDYCNSLLVGLPKFQLQRLQRIQNHAARLIFKQPKWCHVTPLLKRLRWLPINARIDYKLACLAYSFFNGHCSSFVSNSFVVYKPNRQLRSTNDKRIFKLPSFRTISYGKRRFLYRAPVFWNSLPRSVRELTSPIVFKRVLKCYMLNSLNFS